MYDAVIFGLGNILYGDDGFGVRVAERLHNTCACPIQWRWLMQEPSAIPC